MPTTYARASRQYWAHVRTCECGDRPERCARGERLRKVLAVALDGQAARAHVEAVATGREIVIGNLIPAAWFRSRLKRYALLSGTSEMTAASVREIATRAQADSFRIAWYELAHVYAAIHKEWSCESDLDRENRAIILAALRGF